MRTSKLVVAAAGCLAVSSGLILAADTMPAGHAAYARAYEMFMEGDLAGARAAFEKTRDLPDADRVYAADAGLRAGWLYEVAQRLDEGRQAFARVEAMKDIPVMYRAEAALGIGQCHFDAGDVAGASNAFVRALGLLEQKPTAGDDRYHMHWLKTYAVSHRNLMGISEDDPYYNNHLRQRGVKWVSPLEQSVREEILRRWLSEQGLSSDRCYLHAGWVQGNPLRAAPYPASGFPYSWEFNGGDWCGLSMTQGLARVRLEDDCLKFATGAEAGFGWGRSARSDQRSALRFGYATNISGAMPNLTHLRVRMRQSLPESAWTVRVGGLPRRSVSGYAGWDSSAMAVRGTDWQEVLFNISAGTPPYLGIHFFSATPGNEVEIDWVRPEVQPGHLYARKELELPAEARWAKISVSAPGAFTVFVNGKEAARAPREVNNNQIWNYELDASLFLTGINVVAFEMDTGAVFLVDGALLCKDGSYIRFDSDETWRSGVPAAANSLAWTTPEGLALTESWQNVQLGAPHVLHLNHAAQFWFNPSYKGGIMVEPADGRPQPVYGCREPVALRMAVPARAGESPAVRWTLFDAMGDGARPADREVQAGELALRREPGMAAGELGFAAGALASNVAYALVLDWMQDGQSIEQRRYELAVCGPVPLPEVANPTNYTDGMELKLVWEMDAADEPPADAFISMDGAAMHRPSSVIETPLGRFRQPYPKRNLGSSGGGPCNYISYVYRIENPGRPHVAIAEYPDDTVRIQEMRLSEDGNVRRAGIFSLKEVANDTVVLGFDNPLTHEIRHHHCLFFPGRSAGTVSFLTLGRLDWGPETAARVGKIRIYEILNDVPVRRMADAPGPRKWLGQLTERGPAQIWNSCFSSPVSGYFYNNLIMSESPVFYRNWMVAAINMVKRMKFAGENAHYMGQYMYEGVLYPSAFADRTACGMGYSGSLRDYGVLLARMFEENELGLFSTLQIMGSDRIPLAASDEAVAEGAPTFSQVDRHGAQLSFLGRVNPNWIQPPVRGFYEQIINELTALYGGEKGWKGIVLHHYNVTGPSWSAPQHEPGAASYDDYTIARFEEETGLSLPVDESDPERFAKRHDWLAENAAAQWTEWRCAKMHEIYDWTARRLKAVRPDLDFIVYSYASYLTPPLDEPADQALPSIFDYGRRGGIDLERIKHDPNMTLAAANVFVSLDAPGAATISGDFEAWLKGLHDQVGLGRALAHREATLRPFADDGKNALAVRYNWYEAQPRGPDYWLWTYSSPESWPYPQDDYFADYWINSFVRASPRMILHPLMDIVLWNGRETSMSKFAQAFRSLPATAYTRLTGNGRDKNVWIALGAFEGNTYGYAANPYWWETEVTLTLAAGVRGLELTLNETLQDGQWRGRLAPYSMRTFKFEGEPAEAIAGCSTAAAEAVRQDVDQRLDAWRRDLEQGRAALDRVERAPEFTAVIAGAEAALRSGDAADAYDRLTAYPAQGVRRLVELREYSPFITDGWMISRLLPREGRRDVREVGPAAAHDAALAWRPLNVTSKSNRLLPRAHYTDRDGFVYLANRIRVPVPGGWKLCVGHDGGCRVFLDGKEALVEPQRRNPIREDRTQAVVALDEGEHDLLVVFDLDHGMGWGLAMRFQAPDGAPRMAADFPAPLPREQGKGNEHYNKKS